ncbi:hypothetical protein [Agitococcus lubricus]|uniref:Uncharacterized protein n=1 Tax=Agitococcus lubricus TaxID=1077255 RepID=A0A2T5IVQ4_9GAMM|nr:hypothetical protein [Agitococcus lubricus]PTQ87919.1 hypothetical protein C8N29_1154 [Agitococcus lubricus]
MAYLCRDCGNRSTKQFPQGKCPACDSFNILSTHKSTQQAIREREPKTLFEILVLTILWGLLAYGVWERYVKEETPNPTPTSLPTQAQQFLPPSSRDNL